MLDHVNYVYTVAKVTDNEGIVEMGFIPGKKITISTDFTLDQVIEQLHKITEPNRGLSVFRKRSPNIVFRGDIHGNRFKLNTIPQIATVNSFSPVVIGYINQDKVNITIRMNMPILIFWLFWMIVVSIFCAIFTAIMFIDKKFGIEYLIPYFMWIFGYFLCQIGFNSESTRIEAVLHKILSKNSNEIW